jgi:hypothetical protein
MAPVVLKCNSSCSSVIVKHEKNKQKTIFLFFVGEKNVGASELLVHTLVQLDTKMATP